MTEEFAIYAHQLTKTFKTSRGSILAVDHLSFGVKPGETFGLIGPDGAGKSTTTRLMLGLLGMLCGEQREARQERQQADPDGPDGNTMDESHDYLTSFSCAWLLLLISATLISAAPGGGSKLNKKSGSLV